MAWSWDQLEPTPIHDQLWAEVYAPDVEQPKRSRWTWGERGWALLIVVVLAGTVALAYFTGSTK